MIELLEKPGYILVSFIALLEESAIPCVYLRNYDELPEIIGNDADILIPSGTTSKVLEILDRFLTGSGWHIMRVVEFGPMAIFISSDDRLHYFHIDLFERLDWHCLPFANPSEIIRHRVWNGTVHRPAAEDEIYLNVMTRLVYQGCIREKHRDQYGNLRKDINGSRLDELFIGNLGRSIGEKLIANLDSGRWTNAESSVWNVRRMVIARALFIAPMDTAAGLFSYARRGLRRLVKPPGVFVAFEGADGVGKSSIIEVSKPALVEITGKSNLMCFHWKPCMASMRIHGDCTAPAMDPRGKSARAMLPSLAFLFYHWLGFWYGWLRHVRPALVKNRPVVADRYSYEFLLDPTRLRLTCPEWILKLATRCTPRPGLTIALIAEPAVVAGRKNELTMEEISIYQERLRRCQRICPEVLIVSADASMDQVANDVAARINSSCTTWRSNGGSA